MRTRILSFLLALGLALSAGASSFDYINNVVSVTQASQTLTIGTTTRPMASVRVINDGADTVYVRFFRTGETVAAATATATGGYKVELDETYARSSSAGGYVAVSLVCAAGETATVRLWGSTR